MSSSPQSDALHAAASAWTIRRDRGLSASESIEFELWLAADPGHAAAMRRSTGAWALLDRMPDPIAQKTLAQLAAASRRRAVRRRFVFSSLAAAAVLALMAVGWWRHSALTTPVATGPALFAAGPRTITLADGTLVRLNDGGEVVEQFTPTERRVLLKRGEAHFTVTKNPARPFIVSAGALRVRAVGTAFNVNLQSAQVEVLVTEGRVQLATDPVQPAADAAPPLVGAGERAVLPVGSASERGEARDIVVTRVSPAEMARALAWHESLLRLGGSTLAEIAVEFERRSGHRVILADPALAQMRVGGRFRADNVDGFANLLATAFDVDVERAPDGALVLRKKNPDSR